MGKRKIGLRIESLGLEPREALMKAAALQMEGVEIPCHQGELSPRELDRSGRRALRHFLADLKIELAALGGCCDFPFAPNAPVERFMDQTFEIIDLADDLRVPLVTLGVRSTAHPETDGRAEEGLGALMTDLADRSANRGIRLALSAGLDSPNALAAFLDRLRHDGLCTNYDPANMVFGGWDAVLAVSELGPHIQAVRARDGRRYLDGSSEERSLGEGDVPYEAVIDALDDVDFHGYWMIARAPQPGIEEIIIRARSFLLQRGG